MNLANATLRQRIAVLCWALPLSLATVAIVYQLGPARWVEDHYGHDALYGVEILFYATTGPLLAYWTLTQLGHWLDNKEQLERQARATEQRLASITAASADAILGLDQKGCIESWNHGAELIFGYTMTDVAHHSLTDLLGGGAAEIEYRWLVEQVRQAGFVRGHETTCRDADGRQVDVELTATHLTGPTNQFSGMSVILRDVTERKRREEEIRRLNASLREQVAEQTHELAAKVEELSRANAQLQTLDRTRSEFVSLVSHQLRAPLTNISGAIEHIQAHCPEMNATCARMLPIVTQQVERLDRLVRDTLNMTRIESGSLLLDPEPISILPVVQQVVEQMRTSAAARTFRLPLKPGLPLVFADRDQLAEVLINLLDNADKYSPPGRAVVVDVRADQSEVTLSVRDFGPGLPPAELDRVFEKFHRTDTSDSQIVYGYGLGLYICRCLVEAQHGRIWAENHPRGGAVFSFTLPVVG